MLRRSRFEIKLEELLLRGRELGTAARATSTSTSSSTIEPTTRRRTHRCSSSRIIGLVVDNYCNVIIGHVARHNRVTQAGHTRLSSRASSNRCTVSVTQFG